jgi:hypothetical protein
MRSFKMLAAVVILGAGCASGEGSSQSSGALTVQKNTVTSFDAVFARGAEWAEVVVRYSPDSTYYSLFTSYNTVLAFSGTEPGDPTKFNQDPRVTDKSNPFIQISSADREFEIVSGLHQALLAAGATSSPTDAERGTTLYAAGFTSAKVLGLTPSADQIAAAEANDTVAAWPFPGFSDASMLPAELRAVKGDQSLYNFNCCGPLNCNTCNYASNPCDDWCAAGDYCNAHGGGSSCGTICPGISCPHSNSSAINAYSASSPCNTKPKNYCHAKAGISCKAAP